MIWFHDTIVALGFAGAFLLTGAGIGFYLRGILRG